MGEPDPETYVWVTSLTRTLNWKRAQWLLDNCSGLADDEDRRNADSVMNVTSEANMKLFKKMIQEGDQMCEKLKELLAPEVVEFKIRLDEQDARLADKNADVFRQHYVSFGIQSAFSDSQNKGIKIKAAHMVDELSIQTWIHRFAGKPPQYPRNSSDSQNTALYPIFPYRSDKFFCLLLVADKNKHPFASVRKHIL